MDNEVHVEKEEQREFLQDHQQIAVGLFICPEMGNLASTHFLHKIVK